MSDQLKTDSALFGAGEEIEEPVFEDTVNIAISEMKKGDDGNWVVPEGLSPEVKYAVNSEKRRRDTQSAFSLSQQQLKAKEAENTNLKSLVQANVSLNLTTEQKEELEDLKTHNPDKWRDTLAGYEKTAQESVTKELDKISATSSNAAAIESRVQVLEAFTTDNPGFVMNDEILDNDIPPRITKKLESGKITFLEFLTEAKDYMAAGKTTATDTLDEEPDLTKLGGGARATEKNTDNEASYENAIF